MGISPEELALREMQGLADQMEKASPAMQFTEDGSGPYYEPSAEYLECASRLRRLRQLYPTQFAQLPDADVIGFELDDPPDTLADLMSLRRAIAGHDAEQARANGGAVPAEH